MHKYPTRLPRVLTMIILKLSIKANKAGSKANMHKGLAILHKFAIGQVIKQFAAKHHLVYFGGVDSTSDEHQLIRGITASTHHTDNHYTVGTFEGHDLMLVQRRKVVSHPGKPSSNYSWLILAIDLKHSGLPHIFVDGLHHSDAFYANLHIGFAKLQDLTNLVAPIGKARLFAPTDALPVLHSLLKPDFIDSVRSFSNFDYEVKDDQLFIYSVNPTVSTTLLSDMLRVGVWVANYLNGFKQQ